MVLKGRDSSSSKACLSAKRNGLNPNYVYLRKATYDTEKPAPGQNPNMGRDPVSSRKKAHENLSPFSHEYLPCDSVEYSVGKKNRWALVKAMVDEISQTNALEDEAAEKRTFTRGNYLMKPGIGLSEYHCTAGKVRSKVSTHGLGMDVLTMEDPDRRNPRKAHLKKRRHVEEASEKAQADCVKSGIAVEMGEAKLAALRKPMGCIPSQGFKDVKLCKGDQAVCYDDCYDDGYDDGYDDVDGDHDDYEEEETGTQDTLVAEGEKHPIRTFTLGDFIVQGVPSKQKKKARQRASDSCTYSNATDDASWAQLDELDLDIDWPTAMVEDVPEC